MGPLSSTLIFFLLSLVLAFGLLPVVFNVKSTGSGLLRLMHTISLVSTLCLPLMLFISGVGFDMTILLVMASLGFITLLCILTGKENQGPLHWFFYLLQNLLSISLFVILMPQNGFIFIHLFSGALLLGAVTFAMVLGHWYLVTPKLSEKPLKLAMIIIWPALLIKTGILSWSLWQDTAWLEFGSSVAFGGMFNIVMALMRISWGILMVGGLSFYAWRLIKIRSIQSATGVLYVMTFFVFGGEIISTYFYFAHGVLV